MPFPEQGVPVCPDFGGDSFHIRKPQMGRHFHAHDPRAFAGLQGQYALHNNSPFQEVVPFVWFRREKIPQDVPDKLRIRSVHDQAQRQFWQRFHVRLGGDGF
jgi:hypothetical protein